MILSFSKKIHYFISKTVASQILAVNAKKKFS